MKIHTVIKIILISVLISMFFSCNNESTSKEMTVAKADSSISSEKIQTVEVVQAKARSFSAEILITGTALPNQKVMLRAMESGLLKSIRKDIGDQVQKGAVVAVLENPNVSQLITDAEANLQMTKANMETIRSERAMALADIRTKESLYKRLNEVYKKTPELTPISQVEKAEGDFQMAKAAIGTIDAKVAAQKKKIEALNKQLEIAQTKNAMLQIKAPFSGIVTKRFVDQGTMIQSGITNPNAGALLEIQEVHPIRLVLPIPESDAGAIKQGMDVTVSFPEMAGQDFKAKVSRTAKALDPSSKTMRVEVDIPNPDAKIITGMYAKAQMQIGSRNNVLSLPFTAQVMQQDVLFILVVKDGIVERVALRKGLSGKDYFEVLNTEITAETQVIVKGKGLVKVGQRVKPILKGE